MRSVKTRIAAIATVLGLAGLAGVALNAGGQGSSQQAAKPLVRTKVIRRTVHVTKHAKPKHLAVGAPPAQAAAATPAPAASSGAAVEEPVTTATSGTGSEEPVTTAASGTGGEPVTTATSGTGGGEEEHEVDYESEGGGEGFDD